MDTTESSKLTKFKVGLFSLAGFILIVLVSFWVNDRPFWWRGCQFVKISIADATGLKTNSPVRSLGIEIGYLKTVELSETHVALGICITAPVEVLPTTKAYINAEGFLGDKVVELKPVKYLGGASSYPASIAPMRTQSRWKNFLISEVWAAPAQPTNITAKSSKEIPVGESSQDIQKLVNRVDELVNQMSGLTSNLKEGIDPGELKKTIRELNSTLKNASKTFSPEGGLNQTAQRTLAKLEDAIEQLRDQMTRVNKGEGSVGALLNDPSYAEGIKEAINNVNRLLSKVGGVSFIVDVGGEKVNGYEDSRAWGRLGIWPQKDRYYLLGISFDPRGKRTSTTVTTTSGGSVSTVRSDAVEATGLLITAMLGKVYLRRLDLSIGALHGDGTLRVGLHLGPHDKEKMFQITNELYSHSGETGWNDRLYAQFNPFSTLYLKAGIDSIRRVSGAVPYTFGAGLSFSDDDIKLLFALR